MNLHISPQGKDGWSGLLSAPAADGSDGPLASFTGARDRLRRLKSGTYNPRWGAVEERLDGPVTVHVHGGVYAIAAPMAFGPEDSYPVTFRACDGEQPIVDGGVRIEDWTEGEVNGHPCWVADLPEVKAGDWNFRQLFVNGRRASRPRLPKAGLMRMEEAPDMPLPAGWGSGGYTRFVAAEGDVESFRNLNEVEVVYLHFWIEERSPILSFDPDSRLVTMSRPSRAPLVGSHGTQLADYYLDNLFEALSEPGEWYLDRGEGKLYYLPREGETLEETEVWAPRCLQLLAVVGDPEQNRFAEHIRFEGITFRHADWRHP
ncbi:MAG: hypothetical protein HOC74_29510, partial [Gemmatimonadetes bacterium]|nr:hypothetical protein [Gemmatimonadota bacterium]